MHSPDEKAMKGFFCIIVDTNKCFWFAANQISSKFMQGEETHEKIANFPPLHSLLKCIMGLGDEITFPPTPYV